jgi:hypothetical protein
MGGRRTMTIYEDDNFLPADQEEDFLSDTDADTTSLFESCPNDDGGENH